VLIYDPKIADKQIMRLLEDHAKAGLDIKIIGSTAARSANIAWLVTGLAAFALFSKILPWFVQANLHWILLFLPIHVALALVITRRQSDRTL